MHHEAGTDGLGSPSRQGKQTTDRPSNSEKSLKNAERPAPPAASPLSASFSNSPKKAATETPPGKRNAMPADSTRPVETMEEAALINNK
jgi:hypothetical protein